MYLVTENLARDFVWNVIELRILSWYTVEWNATAHAVAVLVSEVDHKDPTGRCERRVQRMRCNPNRTSITTLHQLLDLDDKEMTAMSLKVRLRQDQVTLFSHSTAFWRLFFKRRHRTLDLHWFLGDDPLRRSPPLRRFLQLVLSSMPIWCPPFPLWREAVVRSPSPMALPKFLFSECPVETQEETKDNAERRDTMSDCSAISSIS